jgi:hypothetical protein
MLKKLTIRGLRGFATPQAIDFAIPNGNPGSGLTMLVGPNGGGKTTIIEALNIFSLNGPPVVPEVHRSTLTRPLISLTLENDSGQERVLQTIEGAGGAFGEPTPPGFQPNPDNLFVLPSRRSFIHRFGGTFVDRNNYMNYYREQVFSRGAALNAFPYRLKNAIRHKAQFDALLGRLLDPPPDWTIGNADGNDYLKLFGNGVQFTSEGLGDGVLSVFFVVDALYDSDAAHVVAIDEPELSIHPALQRRIADVLNEYSASRQIVLATHSPYFLDVPAMAAGARLHRVFAPSGQTRIASLSTQTAQALNSLISDQNNPHVMGLDAREAFFLEDSVILVEGQEDVLSYRRALKELGVEIPGHFFGWGVGGATKMRLVAKLLQDLGFTRVVGLLDADQAAVQHDLAIEFPQYRFEVIPALDVRTKPAVKERPAREGLLDEQWRVRPKYESSFRQILDRIKHTLERIS